MGSKTLKRLLTSLLSMSLLCTQFVTMPVFAEENEPESLSVSQIVKNNYSDELLPVEKDILDFWLNSESVTFVAPTDEDNLITIEGDRNVTAATYTEDGNEWVPVKAYLVEDGVPTEIEDFENGKGTISPKTGTYSVEVDYEAYVDVPLQMQNDLLNAGYWAAQTITALNDLSNNSSNGASSSNGVPYLKKTVSLDEESLPLIEMLYNYLVAGETYPVDLQGTTINLSIKLSVSGNYDSTAAIAAITALYEDYKDGDFDFLNLVNDYVTNYSGNQISFITEGKAAEMKAAAETVLEHLETIANCEEIPVKIGTLSSFESYDAMAGVAANTLRSIMNDMTAISEADEVTSTREALLAGLDYDWSVFGVTNLLKPDSYASNLISNFADQLTLHEPRTTQSLLLGTATVGAGVNSADVTYVIDATVVVDNELKPLTFSGKTRIAKETVKADVDATIESKVEEYISANWSSFNLGEEKYVVNWGRPEFETLTDGVTYRVTYEPRNYTVTGVLAGNYPYGTVLTLPSGELEEKLFTYTVNGQIKQEKDTVTVTDNLTITRNEQAKKRLLTLLANDLGLDSESVEFYVLNNAAVDSYYVSYNDLSADGLVKLEHDREAGVYNLKAEEYATDGGTWVPYKYNDGTGDVYFNGNYDVTIENTSIDSVNVEYRLQLTKHLNGDITAGYVSEVASLPYNLSVLSKNQASTVEELKSLLNANKDDLGLINLALGTLRTMIMSDYDTDDDGIPDLPYNTDDEIAINQIGVILRECFTTDEKGATILKVQKYVDAYNNSGLVSYYDTEEEPATGYYAYMQQLNLLIDNLGAVVQHQKFAELLQNEQFKGYEDKVDGIIEKLTARRDSMKNYPPSSYVDATNNAASGLFAKLIGAQDVQMLSANSVSIYASVTAKADGVVGTSVNVTVYDFKGEELSKAASQGDIFTMSLPNGDKFTDQHIEMVNSEINRLYASVLSTELQVLFEQSELKNMPSVNDAAADVVVTVTYVPKTVDVQVEGSGTTTISYGNSKVLLPKSAIAGETYEYVVNGTIITSESYTFTESELAEIINNGGLTITRNVINVGEEGLKNLITDMNSGMTGESEFVLLEKDAEHHVVLKVDASELGDVMGMVMGAAEGLASSPYDYVALGEDSMDHAIWGVWNEQQLVSVQGAVNSLLASGLNLDSLIQLIDDEGNIIESDFNDFNVAGTNARMTRASVNLGGILLSTNLYLGLRGNNLHDEIPFYITIQGSSAEKLLDIKEKLQSVKKFVDVNTENEKLNVIVTLPDKAYQAILAGLLATGYVELDDIENVKLHEFIDYLVYQFEEAVINSKVSADTYQNTINELGSSKSIDEYKDDLNKALDWIRKLYPHVTIGNSSEKTASAIASGHSDDLIKALNLQAPYDAMIKKEAITAEGTLTITNIGTSYEAAYFDNSKTGLDKVGFTKDLVGLAPTLGENAAVVLVGDVDGDVVLNNAVFMDLNGFSISGKLTSNAQGTVKVFNSSFMNDGGAGSASGNLKITGGAYGNDVNSLVAGGYSAVYDGSKYVVESDLYTAKMVNGKLVIELETDFIDPARETELKYLGADLALQLALNFYTASDMSIDGFGIYDVEFKNVIETLKGLDNKTDIANELLDLIVYGDKTTGLSGFANKVIKDLTQFANIATAVENNSPVATYTVTSNPWNVNLTYIENGDYLSAELVGNSSIADTLTVEIRIKGDASEPDNQKLVALLKELDNVVEDVTAEVVLSDVDYNNGVDADYTGTGNLVINFAEAEGGYRYTTIMGMILSYGNPQNTALKAAVQDYITNGNVADLIAQVDNLTAKEVFTAIKSIRGVDYKTIKSGFTGLDAEVAALNNVYHEVLQGMSAVLNKLDVTGDNRQMKLFGKDEAGIYAYSAEGSYRNLTAKVTLKLFAEKDAELIPYVQVGDQILGYEIDSVNKVIMLDLAVTETFNGLGKDKINTVLYGFEVKNGKLIENGIAWTLDGKFVENGVNVVVEFANMSGVEKSETWKFLILGDVNCNGMIESNDANLMMRSHFGSLALLEDQLWAADVNGDYSIGAHDALQNAIKWTMNTSVDYDSKLVAKEGQ